MSAAISDAAVRLANSVHSSSRRLSTCSASTPPNTPSTTSGPIPEKPTTVTRNGEPVSSNTNQPSIVICIQRDMYAKKLLAQSRR